MKKLLLGTCLTSLLLSGCESVGWLGADDEVPLEGERVSLFDDNANIAVAPAKIDVTAELRDTMPMRDVTAEEAAAIAATEAALREMEQELRADPLDNVVMTENVSQSAEDSADSANEDIEINNAETPTSLMASKATSENIAVKRQAMQKARVNVADASVVGGFIKPPVWPNEFWPQAGGYGKHSMQHVAFRENGLPERVWSESIGRGASRDLPLTSTPIVVDSKIFTMDSSSVIRALDVQTGREIWELEVGRDNEDDVIGGGLAFSGGQLYATNGFNDVLAIDPYDGKIRWRSQISGPARAAPSAAMGTPGKVFVTTLDNKLIALSMSDGSLLWSHQGLRSNASLLGSASPAVSSDIVVPAYSSGEVYALNLENGNVAWSQNLSPTERNESRTGITDIRALPVLDKGFVFAMTHADKLIAIDERSGQPIWEQPIGGSQTPWVSGNRIFVLDKNMRLYALNRQDGNVVWMNDLPAYDNPEKQRGAIKWFGPVFAGNRLHLFADDGTAVVVDPVTGQKGEEWDTNIDVVQPPIIAGGKLFLLGRNGTVAAFE